MAINLEDGPAPIDRNYSRVHHWLKDKYGKASKCENIECEAENIKRFEWALIRGCDYEKKRENFMQLCSSCHKKYDFTERARRNFSIARKAWAKKEGISEYLSKLRKETNKGINGKPVIQLSLEGLELAEYPSSNEAARQLNIHQSTISNVIKGKYKTAGGFKWKFKT